MLLPIKVIQKEMRVVFYTKRMVELIIRGEISRILASKTPAKGSLDVGFEGDLE